jgi:hypothetical protein
MREWSKLLDSYATSGVYVLKRDRDLTEIGRLAVSAGLAFLEADLSGAAGKEGFLSRISAALEFPSYFGMNWDALEECLTDLEWMPYEGYVIVVRAVKAFSTKAPAEFRTALAIFKTAVKYWKAQKKPFFVILVD